jgi:hypothetical protein
VLRIRYYDTLRSEEQEAAWRQLTQQGKTDYYAAVNALHEWVDGWIQSTSR